MRNLCYLSLLLGILFLQNSCTSIEKERIQGQWQGVSITENGKALEIDPGQIKLNFLPSEKYTYHSTLNYREAGSYHMDKKYLYTTDTLNLASSQKAVEILLLDEDSLHLKMMENHQERVLKMEKVN